ncbi:UNVERIFIED_CONTAM: hypothetical protein FKN15_060045 [Acipenser sinensis]
MALSTEQALALLLILNSAHLTAADCPPPDHVDVSGSVGGRAVMPCSYTPTPGQDVAVTWYAYQYQGECVQLIYNSKTPSARIPAQWSGRVKLSDEVSSGNASLLISELTLEDTRDYTCIVGINRECVTHRAVKLTVQADCSVQDRVDVSVSAGGRAVLPCSYTPTPGQDVAVRWTVYPDQERPVLLITSKTPSAPIPAQWSGRVKLSDEVSSGNGSLLISELTLEDTGDYTCDVRINRICVTYWNVKLTVQANANGNNQNAGDHNASSDLLTYAVIDHTRQPGGAPVQSGISAVDNTEYATVRIH